MSRKAPETWQLEDATRLRQLFAERVTLTQEEFGAEFKIGNQAAVWQYLSGRIPLNLTAAIRFARGIGCTVGDISPTLAAELDGLGQREASALGEILAAVPPPVRREVVEFLDFKIAGAPNISPQQVRQFRGTLERIRREIDSDAEAPKD